MAATDVTAKDTRVNGINQDTHFRHEEARVIDFATLDTGLLTVATHDLFKLPEGHALIGLKMVVLGSFTSSGSATLQLKASINGTAEAINSSAAAIADLAAGDVLDLPVNKIKGYSADYGVVIQATVGTAALTAGKAFFIAETVPVSEFLTNG